MWPGDIIYMDNPQNMMYSAIYMGYYKGQLKIIDLFPLYEFLVGDQLYFIMDGNYNPGDRIVFMEKQGDETVNVNWFVYRGRS